MLVFESRLLSMSNNHLIDIIKYRVRQLFPKRFQVPLKFYFNALNNQLEQEFKLLRFIVKQGNTVVDIGGNRGAYAYALYKLGTKVHIFEPNVDCALVLSAWAKGKSSIEVHQLALSDKKGTGTLSVPIDEAGVIHDSSASLEKKNFQGFIQQEVNLSALDELDLGKVNFIKIDVEGHEFNVIKGAINTIKNHQPALLIEIEKRHLNRPFEDTFKVLEDLGYQVFFMENGILNPFRNFIISKHQPIASNLNTAEKYINNFLFLHNELLSKDAYKDLLEECS